MSSQQLPLPGVLSDLGTPATAEPTPWVCTVMETLTPCIVALTKALMTYFAQYGTASLCKAIEPLLEWLRALLGALQTFTTP